jgi:hypothetical protein
LRGPLIVVGLVVVLAGVSYLYWIRRRRVPRSTEVSDPNKTGEMFVKPAPTLQTIASPGPDLESALRTGCPAPPVIPEVRGEQEPLEATAIAANPEPQPHVGAGPGEREALDEGTTRRLSEPAKQTVLSDALDNSATPTKKATPIPLDQRPPARIEPSKRGGRARVEDKTVATRAVGQPECQARPEVICRQSGTMWQLDVDPSVDSRLGSPVVLQGEEPLDPAAGGRFPLRKLDQPVEVSLSGRVLQLELLGPSKRFLLFKMRRDWSGRGRMVPHLTFGYFLVVAPVEWQRVDSGTVSVEPERVVGTPRCRAHFVFVPKEKGTVVRFRTAQDQDVSIPARGRLFELGGDICPDASQRRGPLFVGSAPTILAEPDAWDLVDSVVCGEEGRRRRGGRAVLTHKDGQQQQEFLSSACGRSGWYFVRFYDHDQNLLESLDFRFCRSLHSIEVSAPSAWEAPGGPARIRFNHDRGLRVHPANAHSATEARIEGGDTITEVFLPPNPDLDVTEWRLMDDLGQVSLEIALPRVWWRLCDAVPAEKWEARPVRLSSDEITPVSERYLWVRTPLVLIADSIAIGPEPDRTRLFPAYKHGLQIYKHRLFRIPLRDFSDLVELTENTELSLWIFANSEKPIEVLTVFRECRILKFEIVQDNEGNTTILRFRWAEEGEAAEKRVVLTCVSADVRVPACEILVDASARNFEIRRSSGLLPPANYRLELFTRLKSSSGFVEKKALCESFRVLSNEELLKQGEIHLESVSWKNGKIELKDYNYVIRVEGRIIHGRMPAGIDGEAALIKEINDGWYVGEMRVTRFPQSYDMTAEFVCNPVKFEYRSLDNRIVCVEDRDGDGGVFCPICGHIVWRRLWLNGERLRGHEPHLVTDFELRISAGGHLSA